RVVPHDPGCAGVESDESRDPRAGRAHRHPGLDAETTSLGIVGVILVIASGARMRGSVAGWIEDPHGRHPLGTAFNVGVVLGRSRMTGVINFHRPTCTPRPNGAWLQRHLITGVLRGIESVCAVVRIRSR